LVFQPSIPALKRKDTMGFLLCSWTWHKKALTLIIGSTPTYHRNVVHLHARNTTPVWHVPFAASCVINDFVSPLTRPRNHSPLPQTYFGADSVLQSWARAPAAEMHFHSFVSMCVISVHWTC
jgi:hypothetical protein